MFSRPHASTVSTSSALSALAFLPDRVFCGDEACGLFIQLGWSGAVHAASLFFCLFGVTPNGSENFGRAVNV
jgi:hypothetical protein